MSTTIIKDEYSEVLHIRCDCGHFGIVEIGKLIDSEDDPCPFYFMTTVPNNGIKEKLKGIWKVIKGSSYGNTDEVLFTKKEAKKIIKWLQKMT